MEHFATLYVSLDPVIDPVIHRELQNVIYMKTNINVQEKGGRVLSICIFSSCHKILLYKVENILTDVRRK